MKLPERVEVREVGPRDGLQNEPPVSVDARVRLIDALSGTGLTRIEAASFVRAEAIPPMAGSDEVMARDRAPVRRRPTRALVPEPEGRRAGVAGPGRRARAGRVARARPTTRRTCGAASPSRWSPRMSSSSSPTRSKCRSRRSCRPRSDARTKATSRPNGSRSSPAISLDAGADRLSFGDTTGMATPRRVDDLLDALERAGIAPDRVGLHFHDTRGTALANVAGGARARRRRASTRRSVASAAVRTRPVRPATR